MVWKRKKSWLNPKFKFSEVQSTIVSFFLYFYFRVVLNKKNFLSPKDLKWFFFCFSALKCITSSQVVTTPKLDLFSSFKWNYTLQASQQRSSGSHAECLSSISKPNVLWELPSSTTGKVFNSYLSSTKNVLLCLLLRCSLEWRTSHWIC